MKTYRQFINEVRGERVKKRLTQEEVANAIGITRRAYISFEQGRTTHFRERETMNKLCNLLELDLQEFLTEEEKPLKFKLKMTCEVNPETQMYKGLMFAGFVEPGDKVTIVIEQREP